MLRTLALRLRAEVVPPLRDEVQVLRRRAADHHGARLQRTRQAQARERQRVQHLGVVDPGPRALEAERRARRPHLIERPRDARDRPARERHGLPDHLAQRPRRLDRHHRVPPVRGGPDELAALERADVGPLMRLVVVDDAARAQVRAQEHGAVGVRDEEPLQRPLVSCAQQADVHLNRAHLSP